MKYRQVSIVSGKGTAPHQFSSALHGIAVDSEDLLYAAGDSAVKVFGPAGTLERRWATELPGFGLAVGEAVVYVGEPDQIEIFDLSGQLLRTWHDPGKFGLVTAIELLGEYVLVADSQARCIRRYDGQGKFLNNIGDQNRMRGFNIPNGALDFDVDSNGIIHACNPGKHRVERYTPEGELLGHIGRFDGRNPEGFPGCCNPTNVAVTEQGHVFVTEKAGPRAKVLDSEGNLIAVIATEAFDPNCKNMDLAVDSEGRVYVADTVRLQINVFVAGDA